MGWCWLLAFISWKGHQGGDAFSDPRIREHEACEELRKLFQEWGTKVHTPRLEKSVPEVKGRGDTVRGGTGSHVGCQCLRIGFLCSLGPCWEGEKVETNAP